MKRDLRQSVAAVLLVAIGFAFVALPAMAAREAGPGATGAFDGYGVVSDLLTRLGSWFQVLIAPSEEALEPEASTRTPGEGTGQESPGFQEQSGGAADPDG